MNTDAVTKTKTKAKTKTKLKLPQISPGDTVKVSFKVKEANRERVQTLSGLVVRAKKGASGGNFTVRRVTSGIGVEHTFPLSSPLLEKIEVVRHGKVRRAKLYYIRRLSTREARLKERRAKMAEEGSALEAAGDEAEIIESGAEQNTAEEEVEEVKEAE
jgi:large subunit ribosomal protein L19